MLVHLLPGVRAVDHDGPSGLSSEESVVDDERLVLQEALRRGAEGPDHRVVLIVEGHGLLAVLGRGLDLAADQGCALIGSGRSFAVDWSVELLSLWQRQNTETRRSLGEEEGMQLVLRAVDSLQGVLRLGDNHHCLRAVELVPFEQQVPLPVLERCESHPEQSHSEHHGDDSEELSCPAGSTAHR